MRPTIQIPILACLFMSLGSPTIANDYGYQKTEEGIFRALTTPKKAQTFTLRGKKNRGETTSLTVRGITVLPSKSGKIETTEKIITLPSESSGETVNLAIRFAVNSYSINPSSMPILDNLGAALARPELLPKSVSVNGHTDSDGSEQHNLQLSLKRAIAVKQYLALNHGVQNKRLRVMGYGEGIPIVDNTSAKNKQLNRRVEISIIQATK